MRLLVNINNKELTLVFRQPGDPHLLGYPLDLARARAGRVHLGHRRGERPVDPLVALDDVLREEGAGPELGHVQVEVPHARLSLRSLYPLQLLPVASHICSASAAITPLATSSAIQRISSGRLMQPSSNLGIAACAGMPSAMLSIAALVLSSNLALW